MQFEYTSRWCWGSRGRVQFQGCGPLATVKPMRQRRRRRKRRRNNSRHSMTKPSISVSISPVLKQKFREFSRTPKWPWRRWRKFRSTAESVEWRSASCTWNRSEIGNRWWTRAKIWWLAQCKIRATFSWPSIGVVLLLFGNNPIDCLNWSSFLNSALGHCFRSSRSSTVDSVQGHCWPLLMNCHLLLGVDCVDRYRLMMKMNLNFLRAPPDNYLNRIKKNGRMK